jgi:hypothetical protein
MDSDALKYDGCVYPIYARVGAIACGETAMTVAPVSG